MRVAEWWETHLHEVLTGLPPQADPDTAPRPEYDPAVHSLAARERAKAAELAELGIEGTSERTLRRKRKRYQERGLAGLVDRRGDRGRPLLERADQRMVAALRQAMTEAVEESSRTVEYFRWRTERILAAQYGDGVVAMPSRASFYRLFAKVDAGRHTIGSARTRRSLAQRPEGPFGQVTASRPGELMQIDSTPFDVLVLLDDGVPGRVELTGMVDLATRTVTAAVLRPTTKSVDASLLLARTVTPEVMRPGWKDALSMARSVLPYQPLLEIDQRLEHAAARPVIVPELIVCDRGAVFLSRNFRASCRALGISVQPAHPNTPTDKPHIERTLGSISTLFCQFVASHLGRSAELRGRNVENGPLWSMLQLQELLDEWIVAKWQNRPHDGLRDPSAPRRAFTPNEKYATLVATASTTFLSRCPARTTSNCCRRAGGPSAPRASRSTTASMTALISTLCVGRTPAIMHTTGCGRCTTTPTTCPASGYAGGTANGSPCPGGTCPRFRARSGSWPGITLAGKCPTAPRKNAPGQWPNCWTAPIRARPSPAVRHRAASESRPAPGQPPARLSRPRRRTRPRARKRRRRPRTRPSPRSSPWGCSTRSRIRGGSDEFRAPAAHRARRRS